MTREEWVRRLEPVFEGTKYEILINPTEKEYSVIVREKGTAHPQYIAIWPPRVRRTTTNVFLSKDAKEAVKYAVDLERYYYPNAKNSNDYRDVPDEFIIDICVAFVKHNCI